MTNKKPTATQKPEIKAALTLLSIDDIAKAEDLQLKTIAVPEWGGSVMLRTLGAKELDAYQRFVTKLTTNNPNADFQEIRSNLLGRCMCNARGEPLFENEAKAAEVLNAKRGKVVYRLFAEAQNLNGLTPEATDDAKKA